MNSLNIIFTYNFQTPHTYTVVELCVELQTVVEMCIKTKGRVQFFKKSKKVIGGPHVGGDQKIIRWAALLFCFSVILLKIYFLELTTFLK